MTVLLTTGSLLIAVEMAFRIILQRRYGGFAPIAAESEGTGVVYDELLGWRRLAGQRWAAGNEPHTTNAQGFRATREFAIEVPNGRYRILCLGDSFTQGIGGDDETFPHQLEVLSPTIEAVNMGRGAYGIDQAYLSYKRDGLVLQTNMLLFAFIEDDFHRMRTNAFRVLRPKPQLLVRNNTLELSNVPVPRWATFPTNTALYKVLNRTSENLFSNYDIFPVVERIFNDLKVLSRERHQELVLVYLPSELDWPGEDRPPRDIVRRVEQIARDRQIHFWNLTPMFQGLPPAEVASQFVADGHYSPRGNHLTASTLLARLRTQFADVSW